MRISDWSSDVCSSDLDHLDIDDPEAEGDEDLVLMRPAVEVPDDQPLHHDADEHHEDGAGRDGNQIGIGQLVGNETGIAADHEHRAVREVEDTQRAVDDRQAGTRSEEHTSELQSLMRISYAVFCLKK